jgi:hypothetical protein
METHNSLDTSNEFIIYSSKQGRRAAVLGGHAIVVIGNRRNLQSLLSGHKNILGKAAVLHFALAPFCNWGLCQPSLQIIGHSCAYITFS